MGYFVFVPPPATISDFSLNTWSTTSGTKSLLYRSSFEYQVLSFCSGDAFHAVSLKGSYLALGRVRELRTAKKLAYHIWSHQSQSISRKLRGTSGSLTPIALLGEPEEPQALLPSCHGMFWTHGRPGNVRGVCLGRFYSS